MTVIARKARSPLHRACGRLCVQHHNWPGWRIIISSDP